MRRYLLISVCMLAIAVAAGADDPTSKYIPVSPVPTTLTASSTGVPVQFEMWDSATGGIQISTEAHTVDTDATSNITNDTGFADLLLGRPGGLNAASFLAGSSRYFDVTQSGVSVLAARMPIYATAFSVAPGPQGPPGVVQSIAAGDASVVVVGGGSANPTVAVATNGITNSHVANGALSPAKISGTAATQGPNSFKGDQSIAGSLNVSANISAATVFGNTGTGVAVHGIGQTGGMFETGTGLIFLGRGLGFDRVTMAANGDMRTTGNLRVEGGVAVGGTNEVDIDAPGVVGGRMKILPNGDVGIGLNRVPFAKFEVFANSSDGVMGTSASATGNGVIGQVGYGSGARGVFGAANDGVGVYGQAGSGPGGDGIGVYGVASNLTGVGVYGRGSPGGFAGYFAGNAYVSGKLGVGVTNPLYYIELPNVANNSGQGRANAWVTYSSVRWKENITSIEHALEKVGQLRGVYYDTKTEKKHSIGVIAEELGSVIPEVVDYEENGTDARSVDYGRLTALLIEAVKEQHAVVKSQQALLTEQLAEIGRLKSEFQRMQTQMNELASSLGGTVTVLSRRP